MEHAFASHLPLLCFHISAVRQQLFSSSVAPNRFHVSDIRLRRIIAPAKLIQACFVRIHNHAEQWHFSRPLLAGRLIPTCHNLFLSILPITPPPFFFSPHPPLSCSVTLTPSLHPLTQRAMSPRSKLRIQAAKQPL